MPKHNPDSTSLAPTATQTGAVPSHTSHAAMLSAAQQSRGELQAVAAFLGVDYGVLLKCLLKTVGFLKVLQALRSGDVWSAIGAVDWEKVIDCVSAQIGGGGFSGEPGQDPVTGQWSGQNAEGNAEEFTG